MKLPVLVIFLIYDDSFLSGDACKDNTVPHSNRVHPTNCHHYIQCQNKKPYGQACQENFCFGIHTVETCKHCDEVTCPTQSKK